MDKIQVSELVAKKSERISLHTNNGSSAVWKSYDVVHVDDKETGFVKCRKCDTLLKWQSRSGTSTMKDHTAFCATKTVSQNIRTFMTQPKKSSVPTST